LVSQRTKILSKVSFRFDSDTLAAYLLGIFRAISFDCVAFIEVRGVTWNELKKIGEEMRNEILNTANRIEKD